MEIFLIVIVVIGVLVWLSSASRSSTRSGSSSRGSTDSTGKQRILEANEQWLNERWRMADAEKAAGNLRHFSKWYFDDATDRQRNRLAEEGVSITSSATKGAHSDVIGLFEEPGSEDIEKLKFFGVTLKGALRNQTRARHEIAKLDADPDKQRAWLTRPASALQKEFYRFIGVKPPAGLTQEQANAKMNDTLDALTDAQHDEWRALEDMIEAFDEREFRSEVEIRKPSPADIRSAMTALKAEGKEFDDPNDVAEKLLEMKPALARDGTV